MTNGYDIIGDVHGCATALRELLERMEYRPDADGTYRHPTHQAVFLGDLIDRGPEIRETVEMVRAMWRAGTALAVLGNHEFNLICYMTPDGEGGYLRPHGKRQTRQHRTTLAAYADCPSLLAEHVEWFKCLPFARQLRLPLLSDDPEDRYEHTAALITHACWHGPAIELLDKYSCARIEELRCLASRSTPAGEAADLVLKGAEIALPPGCMATDRDGVARGTVRVAWWRNVDLDTVLSYRALSFPCRGELPDNQYANPAQLARIADCHIPWQSLCFIGHYALRPGDAQPDHWPLVCLDYGAGKDGWLCAYQWRGERQFYPSHFTAVRTSAEMNPTPLTIATHAPPNGYADGKCYIPAAEPPRPRAEKELAAGYRGDMAHRMNFWRERHLDKAAADARIRLCQALNTLDEDLFRSLLADDVVFSSVYLGDRPRGSAEVGALFGRKFQELRQAGEAGRLFAAIVQAAYGFNPPDILLSQRRAAVGMGGIGEPEAILRIDVNAGKIAAILLDEPILNTRAYRLQDVFLPGLSTDEAMRAYTCMGSAPAALDELTLIYCRSAHHAGSHWQRQLVLNAFPCHSNHWYELDPLADADVLSHLPIRTYPTLLIVWRGTVIRRVESFGDDTLQAIRASLMIPT